MNKKQRGETFKAIGMLIDGFAELAERQARIESCIKIHHGALIDILGAIQGLAALAKLPAPHGKPARIRKTATKRPAKRPAKRK